MKLLFKKEDERAIIPNYQSLGAAGFDFHCLNEIYIPPYSVAIVGTGLSVAIPKGYEMQIRPRSGMSIKYPNYISNSPGTIDSDYRGEIGIIVTNNNRNTIKFNSQERIAQGVISKVEQFEIVETDNLDNTERGAGAYGSTGQ